MVAAAAEGSGAVLEPVAERIGTAVQGFGPETVWRIAAEERDSGPGMGSVILETFPASQKL